MEVQMPKDITQKSTEKSTQKALRKPVKKLTKKHASWKDYLNDLDTLYYLALAKENITAALKIKEIQIKAHHYEQQNVQNFDLDTLSDAHLDRLIELVEGKSQCDTPESA
jgi:hypothetical protein